MANRCSNSECKNSDNKDVYRWQLTDALGFSCGTVCKGCADKQKAKYKSVIFKDPQAYRQEMAECGENIDDEY